MPETIALIPARGGSRRIPRKNIKNFLGVPALARVVHTLQTSQVIDRVIVSTDDREIASVAQAAGAEVPFIRPVELADDHTGARPVIQHAIEAAELAPGTQLGVFYPTAVLTTPDDVSSSSKLFQNEPCDFVISVVEFPAPIERALDIDERGGVSSRHTEFTQTRTQDLRPAYYDTGQFYWGSVDAWQSDVPVVQSRTHAFIIDPWRTVDIDTPDDWRRAELLHQVLHAQ